MKKLIVLFTVLFASVSAALGQSACTLQSCRSFHELLNRKDADILDQLSDDQVFVCFRSNEDSFFIADRMIVPNHHWMEDAGGLSESKSGSFHAYGAASLYTYKDGQADESFSTGASDHWKAWGHRENGKFVMEGSPTFSDNCALDNRDKMCSFYEDNAVLKFSRTFLNKNDSSTHLAIEVRFSTGRFSETYTWEKTANAQAGEKTDNGRCEVYSKSKRIR